MSTVMRLLLAAALGLGLFFLGWQLNSSHGQLSRGQPSISGEGNHRQPLPVARNQHQNLAEENHRLLAEVQVLTRELEAVEHQRAEQQQRLEAVRESVASHDELRYLLQEMPDQSDALTLEVARGIANNIEGQAESIIQKRSSHMAYGALQPLADDFAREPANPDWAIEREQLLRRAFAIDVGLQGVVLNSVECRSLRCRIQLYYSRPDEVSRVSGKLTSYLKASGTDLFSSVTSVGYLDEELAEIYLVSDTEWLFVY